MKKVKVFCSQTVWYSYELDIPNNVDVEDYVYATLRDCDEETSNDTPIKIGEYESPIVEDIEDCE